MTSSPGELLLAIGIVIATARYAILRDASGLFWGLVSLVLVVGSAVFVPFPYLRLVGAFILAVVALEAWHRRL